MEENNKTYKYDVAISFAGEDKDIAVSLSNALENEGLKTYYYPDKNNQDIGKNLEIILPEIYSEQARYALVLLSDNYFESDYTKIELEAIQKRMEINSSSVYMLPINLNQEFSFSKAPDFKNIIHFKWESNPRVIAKAVKEFFGKELLAADENSKQGSIFYTNNGDNSFIIADSNIENFDQSIITNNTNNSIYVTKSEIINNNITQHYLTSPKEKKFSCVNCSYQIEFDSYGKVICNDCGKTNYIENPDVSVKQFHTLEDNEQKTYAKVLARIRNKIQDEDYRKALEYCYHAEEIGPGEFDTWEHFALVEFLVEINKKKSEKDKKSTKEIIKRITINIEKYKKYKTHENEDDEFERIQIEIANTLFKIEKSRIYSLLGKYNTNYSLSKWSKYDFENLLEYLKSFEYCYGLYQDPIFLEEYIKILSIKGMWIVFQSEYGDIHNLPTKTPFNAKQKYNTLIKKIKLHKPNYIPELIDEETFKIKKQESINIISIKTKNN